MLSANQPGASQTATISDTGRHVRMAALLQAAQRGDRAALDTLIQELTPLLWQVARAQGLGRDSSADVVQTTWLELLGSLSKIRTPVALTSWLVTVTKREAWRVRKVDRSVRPDEDAVFALLRDSDPIPDEQILQDDQRRRLWAVVDELPERCRTLLRIIAFAHRPDYAAVSAALGMPVGSIGPNRGRCLAKLRKLLMSDPAGGWR
jgi:RNA polymerase sigma factor (sigma-70 family)